jgi:NAD(P)-dependent dehydrogenase (short-subunit alcohol dehydrogenase family)
MDLQLVTKRAFISGSTQGIGYAIAKTLLSEGATVVINGRSEESVASAVVRLKGEVPGGSVSGIAADLADASQTESLLAELGDVDILVNNIGIFDI